MVSKFEFLTALRYLKSKKNERALSVIANFSLVGISLGVAAIIVVMSVMNGFREELVQRILGINGHVSVYSSVSPKIVNYKVIESKLKKIARDENSGIKRIVPTIDGQVMVSLKGNSTGAMIKGMNFNHLKEEKLIADSLIGNSFENLEKGDIVIGHALARKLGAYVGDKITVTSPSGNVTAFGTMPKIRSFKIGAIFNVGMYEYDSSFAFMGIEDAGEFFNKRNSIDYFELFVEEPDFAENQKELLVGKMGSMFKVFTWKEVNSSYYTALKVERNVMFLILTLIILIASFNIISTLVILVKNKSRDIAVLRTVGASKNSIVRIFFLTGASLGVLGTISGVLLGLIISYNIDGIKELLQSLTGTELFSAEIYFLSQLPSKVQLFDVFIITLTSLLISFVVTIFPSLKAAKTDPVETLRYE